MRFLSCLCCINFIIMAMYMKQLERIAFLSIGILLLACSHKETVYFTSFPIEKDLKYSTFDVHGLFDPFSLVLSNKYLFLLGIKSDPIFQQYELQNLTYLKSFGNRGRGPGEFPMTPIIYVSRNPEKLYICHSAQKAFSSYKIIENGDLLLENEFITTQGVLYNQFHIIKDSFLVYNLVPKIGIEVINLLTDENSTQIEFTKNRHYTGEDFLHPDFGTLTVNNQYIVYAYKYRKQIDIYDIKNLKLKTRLLAKGHSETITTTEHSKFYYCDVYTTENFIYVYFIDTYSNDVKNKYYIEVFDFNGTPLKRYNIGIALGCGLWAVTSDDSAIYGYCWSLDDKILRFDLIVN